MPRQFSPPSAVALSEEQSRALAQLIGTFDPRTRQRGDAYWRQGRVRIDAWDGGAARATVRGGDHYDSNWYWDAFGWDNECSCPVGVDCKHLYAAACALLGLGSGTIATAPARPPHPAPRGPKPAARADLAAALRASRDPWQRRGIVRRLFIGRAFSNLSGYDPAVEEILEEPDTELLCWRLARLVASRADGVLPAELEPYRERADLAERQATRERQALLVDLLDWTKASAATASRALRFVWAVRAAPSGRTWLEMSARLTSSRFQDEPRSLEQLQQLHGESLRRPGFLPVAAQQLLGAYFDACSRAGLWHGGITAPAAALGMLRAGGPLDERLMTWSADIDPELCARAGIAADMPLRIDPTPLRVLPAATPGAGGARLELACLWPDGRQLGLRELVYLPGPDPTRSPGAVIADGCLMPVVTEPPPHVRDRLLASGGLHIPRPECGAVLAPFADRYPHVRAALADRTRRVGGTPILMLDLRDDDWLQVRLLVHSDGAAWLPDAPPSADAVALELSPSGRWQRWEAARRPTAEAIDVITPAAADPAGAPAAAPAVEDVWLEEPDLDTVAPARAWLEALGAQPGAQGRPGGSAPTAADRDVGWWVQATPRRMAVLAEIWETRPPSVRFLGNERMRRLLTGHSIARPTVRVTASGVDWFAVSAEWQAEGAALSDADLGRLRAATSRFVRLSGGWVRRDAVEAHDASAAALADLGVEVGGGEQRITLWQLAGARPESLAALQDMAAGRAALQALAALRRRLRSFRGVPEVQVPKGIAATLRPYQRQGLSFLAYAARLGIGAILADDMGLGKTLQALAWLQHLVDQDAGGGPSLVVCPTSVMQNWAREAAQFAPRLRVLTLASGAARHALRRSVGEHDLVITNYALLRRDLEQWRGIALRAAILDEAQFIKNPDAAVSQAACALDARHRLALTGTPLENRPLDLWSITRFANPGYLGDRADFSARYDRLDAPPHARALLAAKLRPILLRRLKRDVAADLPERIEERRDCELTTEQRHLYLDELRRSRRLVDDLGGDAAALRRNKITILAALTRLRQICCHPALAKGKASLGSGKFDALFELLEPLLAEGHKVLLFSQFVRCLTLLGSEMRRRGIAHHVLTGQTVRRQAVVDAFQSDERPCVFLLSLKAGGTGLNLTAASYVVLFDPWWNPAVEAQAIDRTHRIGQDRTVIAYRLIARGTIEEKIWELQQQKAAMVRDVLGEAGFGRALDRAALDFLLHEA